MTESSPACWLLKVDIIARKALPASSRAPGPHPLGLELMCQFYPGLSYFQHGQQKQPLVSEENRQ